MTTYAKVLVLGPVERLRDTRSGVWSHTEAPSLRMNKSMKAYSDNVHEGGVNNFQGALRKYKREDHHHIYAL